MNTVTRMYLVSEDQFKRNLPKPSITRRILNKNLPAETMVRFINNRLARKPNLGYRDDENQYADNQQNDYHTRDYDQSLNPNRSDSQNEDDVYITPSRVEYSEGSTTKPKSDSSSEMEYGPRGLQYTPISVNPPDLMTFEQSSRTLPFSHTSTPKPEIMSPEKALELGIRNIPDLVDKDGGILKENGTKLKDSDVGRVLVYLRTRSPATVAPNGAKRVWDAISKHNPKLLKLVNNKKYTELKWSHLTEK